MTTTDTFEIRNLILFYVVAFGFSWAFWIPEALFFAGILPASPITDFLTSPDNPAAWGPMVAALLLTYKKGGLSGVRNLLARGVDRKFKPIWYAVIFLLMPLITFISLLAAMGLEGYVPVFEWIEFPIALIIAFFYILLLGGPLQEEFGWRGYALDRFQGRFDALTSSLIVGLMWGLWHLPLFFMPTHTVYYNRPIWGLVISTIFLAVLFTWVYNNTNGSILAALLFHTIFNWSHYVFPVLQTDLGATAFLVLQFVAVVIVVLFWGYKRLVRDETPDTGGTVE